MSKKLIPYVNRYTGDVKIVTKSQAKSLSEDYDKVEFTTNDEGKRVMRIRIVDANGVTATADVMENGEREVSVDGDGKSK